MRFTPLLLLTLYGAASSGCNRHAHEFPKPPPPKVTVVTPLRKAVTTYHHFTGQTDAVESTEIRARVRGYLSKIEFQEGTEVQQGAVLYKIDPREYQATLARAQADVLRAKAGLSLAQAEEQRSARLRQSNAVTEEEYQQRVATRLQAEATLKQVEAAVELAQLDLSYCTITAPIAGRVGRTQVTVGNLVGYNEPTLLTTIVRLDPIYVYFDAPERQFIEYQALIRQQAAATAEERKIPVFVSLETETGYPHEGVIDFRDNRVDANSGTVTIRAVLPNANRQIVPGMFARLRVPIGSAHEELLVPQEAIASDQRGTYVLVVSWDDAVEYRAVTTGQEEGELIVISKGLTPDDRVIASGTQKARPGGKVTPVEQKPESQKPESTSSIAATKTASSARRSSPLPETASDKNHQSPEKGPVLR
jgi:multidrug efflux system membrane fusion protein